MFDLLIPTCCIEGRVDEKGWGLRNRRNEWKQEREVKKQNRKEEKGRTVGRRVREMRKRWPNISLIYLSSNCK